LSLSREQVLHIARLARVHLEEEEISRLQAQLSGILEYFEELNAVDVTGVPPTAHTLPIHNVSRDDEQRPSMPQAEVLRNAPEAEDGMLRVRAVFE
jgi:aspartyl-tRNA(Asn)/glutamyl-tRNA(Gln) amidotransferase subunit C